MSDGQDQHDSIQARRYLLGNIKTQAAISMNAANFSYQKEFSNSSNQNTPSVDSLAGERIYFLFNKTDEFYRFPNSSGTFDAQKVGPNMTENVEKFLITFADCMSRFESAFNILNDTDGKNHPALIFTEIKDYMARFGQERLVKTEYSAEDFDDDLMRIPSNDEGKRWKARALLHRDFAMTATYFSQAMDYVYEWEMSQK